MIVIQGHRSMGLYLYQQNTKESVCITGLQQHQSESMSAKSTHSKTTTNIKQASNSSGRKMKQTQLVLLKEKDGFLPKTTTVCCFFGIFMQQKVHNRARRPCDWHMEHYRDVSEGVWRFWRRSKKQKMGVKMLSGNFL